MPHRAKGAPLSPRPHPDPDARVLALGAVTRADVPAASARLRALMAADGAEIIACDVGALGADVVSVEALARLQLTAWRLGCRLRLRHASRELEGLIALCGLGDILPESEFPPHRPDVRSHPDP